MAVELPVEGVIAGVRVHGIVDLPDIEEPIIDCKTAARQRTIEKRLEQIRHLTSEFLN